ncbi:MAG: TIGR03862 family flavoprotein [Paracoccaceae bacterium]
MGEDVDVLVVGAGPAGLMAAEAASGEGARVLVAEAMPSPARKFLMAGKSGLNLAKDEDDARHLAAYAEAGPRLAPALDAFGPRAVADWARGLGQAVFTGSSGRVFPVAMKASPLLRAWLARLDARGVTLRRRWRWAGFEGGDPAGGARFETPEGARVVEAGAVVLAMGGASWRRLGSDGAWAGPLADLGVACAPFRPANVGLSRAWSGHMAAHYGRPLKPLRLSAGGVSVRGEAVIAAGGLEGGGLYPLSRPLREGAGLVLDLAPDLSLARATARLARQPSKRSAAERLRRGLGLDAPARALVAEVARPLPADPGALAALVKALAVPHDGPRPIDEAISTAGGVAWDALDDALMLRRLPRVFCAGEMIDWEAPTGGYLITASLATGRRAGLAAARRATASRSGVRCPRPCGERGA